MAVNYRVVPGLNQNPAYNYGGRNRDRISSAGSKGTPSADRTPSHYRPSQTPSNYRPSQTPPNFRSYQTQLSYGTPRQQPLAQTGHMTAQSDPRYNRGRHQYRYYYNQYPAMSTPAMSTPGPMYHTPGRTVYEKGLVSPQSVSSGYMAGQPNMDQSTDPDVTGLVYFNIPNTKQIAAVQKFKKGSAHQYANQDAYIHKRNVTFTDNRPRENANEIGGVFLSRSRSVTETGEGEEQEVSYNIGADDDPEITLEQEHELYRTFRNTEVASEQETIDKALRDLDLEDYSSDGGLK